MSVAHAAKNEKGTHRQGHASGTHQVQAIKPRPTTLPEPVRSLLAPATEGDSDRQADLNRMKFLAAGLLVIAFIIFVAASFFADRYVWVGFVQATAEAAMVGALADWFAVTALFRHPLGLKIPHTAIIPHRKDQIAETFGQFVKANFLSTTVIGDRLASLNAARQAARWLSRPENSEAMTGYVMVGLSAAAEVMKDEDVQQWIEQSVGERVRRVQLAPVIGNLLAVVVSGRRQQELLKGIMKLGVALLAENREAIIHKIGRETPWWMPHSVDQAIYHKVTDALTRTVTELEANPNHPLHRQFEALVQQFVADLKHSPEVMAREEALKEELLQHEVVREFSLSLWTDVKASLLRQADPAGSSLRPPIQQGLQQLAQAVLRDEAMQAKVNRWIEDGALFLVREYGYEAEQLITQTIQRWDAGATSNKIELHIGKDLQYIRINGTVVGGLAGLAIHTFAYFFL